MIELGVDDPPPTFASWWVAHPTRVLRMAWSDVEALPRTGARAERVSPADEPLIERAFALPPGLIAKSRAHVLLQILDADEPIGFARFDTNFPGAFPFCARDPAIAADLLEAMRPFALPDHDFVGLVLENQEPLADWLSARGASEKLRLFHIVGDLA
jgi:hypothetical protein